MSKELAIVDPYAAASLDQKRQYVMALAQAGDLLPRTLWAPTRNADGSMNPPSPSPGKVLLMAETGAMLGLHPMAALQGIHIVEGKPTLSANLLAALVRRAGHRLRVSTSGSWRDGTFVAKASLWRSDDPDFEFVVEWGVERATRAGLVSKKGPWQSYPEAMCKSRAITEVIREGAPDVTLVPAYTPEELGANVREDGEPVDMPASTYAPPAQQQPQQQPATAPQSAPQPDPVVEGTVEPDEPQQTPQSAPQQQTQADVVDAEIAMSEDWIAAASNASTSDEVLAIYRAARLKGELVAKVEIDGAEVELGTWLVSIGKAMKEAEIAGAAEQQGTPAVLDGTEG